MVSIIDTTFDGTAHYRQSSVLDGVTFVFDFDYNVRDEHWYLSLSTQAGEPILGCLSMKIVQNWSIMRLSEASNRPAGMLLVASEYHNEPGLFDLGNGTLLFYIPEAEL